ARAFGEHAIGVVLAGNGTDGARGCRAILEAGGAAFAQEPEQCAFPNMPAAAIAIGKVKEVLPLGDIAPALQRLWAKPPRQQEAAAATPAVRLLLADDHKIIRDGLRALLQSEAGF